MISIDTLLAAFNEKGTLLKWLQKMEAALKNATLVDVTTSTNGNDLTLSFNFADGTKVVTPAITLPAGPQGPTGATGHTGVGIQTINNGNSYISGDKTITPITVTMSDDTATELTVSAQNGKKGDGIVSIRTLNHSTVDNEEITTVEVVTDENTQQFKVHAQNGRNGSGFTGLWKYTLYIASGQITDDLWADTIFIDIITTISDIDTSSVQSFLTSFESNIIAGKIGVSPYPAYGVVRAGERGYGYLCNSFQFSEDKGTYILNYATEQGSSGYSIVTTVLDESRLVEIEANGEISIYKVELS